jgi:hypothetical protein
MYLPCVLMVLRRPNEGTLPISARLLPSPDPQAQYQPHE